MTGSDAAVTAVAVDNDVVLKASCYGVCSILWPDHDPIETIGVLGQARFVVSKQISRLYLNGSADRALADLAALLGRAEILEPSDEEIALAAEIEAQTATGNNQADVGESQLAAIVVSRGLDLLQTGDKRAVRAMEAVLDSVSELNGLMGRVMCLEQLIVRAVSQGGLALLRPPICSERGMDTALAMCFACHSPDPSEDDVLAGLSSYIADLRRVAPRVLVA